MCGADINGDGKVGISDLGIVAGAFGRDEYYDVDECMPIFKSGEYTLSASNLYPGTDCFGIYTSDVDFDGGNNVVIGTQNDWIGMLYSGSDTNSLWIETKDNPI